MFPSPCRRKASASPAPDNQNDTGSELCHHERYTAGARKTKYTTSINLGDALSAARPLVTSSLVDFPMFRRNSQVRPGNMFPGWRVECKELAQNMLILPANRGRHAGERNCRPTSTPVSSKRAHACPGESSNINIHYRLRTVGSGHTTPSLSDIGGHGSPRSLSQAVLGARAHNPCSRWCTTDLVSVSPAAHRDAISAFVLRSIVPLQGSRVRVRLHLDDDVSMKPHFARRAVCAMGMSELSSRLAEARLEAGPLDRIRPGG